MSLVWPMELHFGIVHWDDLTCCAEGLAGMKKRVGVRYDYGIRVFVCEKCIMSSYLARHLTPDFP